MQAASWQLLLVSIPFMFHWQPFLKSLGRFSCLCLLWMLVQVVHIKSVNLWKLSQEHLDPELIITFVFNTFYTMFYRLLQSIMNELSKSQFEWKLICLFKVHIMPNILWWHSAKVDIFKDFANARFSNRIGNNIKYKEMPEQSLYIRSHFASVAQFRPVAQKFVLEEMCRPVKFFTWRKAMIRFNFHFCSVSVCSICFFSSSEN